MTVSETLNGSYVVQSYAMSYSSERHLTVEPWYAVQWIEVPRVCFGQYARSHICKVFIVNKHIC